MPFDLTPEAQASREVTTLAMAGTCLGGVVIAVVVAVLLYAFVRYVAT